MAIRRITVLLPLAAAAALAACGGSGGQQAAAKTDTTAGRVWTPEQARALREARARGDTVPGGAAVVPVPGPSEGEDSTQWLAEEKRKYDQRVRSMAPYADCMARARDSDPALRPQIEAACHRLPSAPH